MGILLQHLIYHPWNLLEHSLRSLIQGVATTFTLRVKVVLIILTFSGSFGLFLTSYAWFFVMLALTNLLLNTSLCAVSLESA